MNAKVQSFLKKFGLILGLLILGFYALTCAYYLPRTDKVKVSGIEVKRQDVELKEGGEQTRDVRYIMTQTLDGSPRVFRNEDTGWGWPPYFKFDSGDLAAEATNIAKSQPDAIVLVRYYGWRINVASLYPNAVSLEVVGPGHDHFPLFNIVFVGVSLFLFILAYFGLRRLARWRPFHKSEGAPAAEDAESAEAADG